jgi:hypothetical protein
MAEGRVKCYSHQFGHGFIVCVRGKRVDSLTLIRQPHEGKEQSANQDLHH